MKRSDINRNAIFGLLTILAVHILFLLKTQFTAWPEMMLWPYLMANGWLPYRDIAIAHTPLLPLILSAYNSLFGFGVMQLKIFTWAVILLTDILLYWLISKKYGRTGGLYGLLFYIPLQIIYFGNGLWFESALTLLGLLLFYFLKTKKYLWLGVIFAMSLLFKQTAIYIAMPILLGLISQNNKGKEIQRFMLSFFAVIGVFMLIVLSFGIFDDFYKWAIEFGIFTLPKLSGQIKYPATKEAVYAFLPFMLIIPYLVKKKDLILPLFALTGVMGVFPRWELFHFQPALPFLAMIFSELIVEKKKTTFTVLILVFTSIFIFYKSISFIKYYWGVEDRFIESNTLSLSEYLDSNTNNGERAYVVNYWDNVYTLSETLPAVTPWTPQLNWYITPEIESDMTDKLLSNPPKFIVWENRGKFIPDSFYNYFESNYRKEVDFNELGVYRLKE